MVEKNKGQHLRQPWEKKNPQREKSCHPAIIHNSSVTSNPVFPSRRTTPPSPTLSLVCFPTSEESDDDTERRQVAFCFLELFQWFAELLETVKNHGSGTRIKASKASSTPWTPELSHFHYNGQDKSRWRGDTRGWRR